MKPDRCIQPCDCPRCNEKYRPDTKLERIESLCRKYATPASNCGAHELAEKVLAILEQK